jgi:GNAT superfamily N-acetyltransferase
MTEFSDAELYDRGAETLLASFAPFFQPDRSATSTTTPSWSAGSRPPRAAALGAMEGAYAVAGVARFAAWVHERDPTMRADLERRGYAFDSSTRAMGMALSDIRLPRPEIELGSLDCDGHLRLFGLPPDLLVGFDPAGFRLVAASLDGEPVAAALAYDHAGDCGIYNVETVEHARRRGLGTALTAHLLYEARERGCLTASRQSTPLAERVYAAAGFRDLGRFLE